MLGEVLIKLSTELDTGLFGKIYPLVRTITTVTDKGVKTFPGFNTSKGQYAHVLEDSPSGVLYHRINGDITFNNSDLIKTTSCGNDGIVILEYPIRQVAFIQRDVMQCADIFTEEMLMLWLVDKTLRSNLGSAEASVEVQAMRVISDTVKVLSGEYSKFREMVDVNYEWAYIAVEYKFKIQTNLNCLCRDEIY